jgi:hypothetical protein
MFFAEYSMAGYNSAEVAFFKQKKKKLKFNGKCSLNCVPRKAEYLQRKGLIYSLSAIQHSLTDFAEIVQYICVFLSLYFIVSILVSFK